MKKAFNIIVLITSAMFVIALCGCSENYKRYKEAKERMSRGADDASIAISMHQRDLPRREQKSYFLGDYLYYEWAAELFDELDDYKDSKELAKEARYHAAVYFYEQYNKNHKEYYLTRAYQLLLKAGEYKDASDMAVEYSAIMLQDALDYNEKRKPHEESENISKLFMSFDEKSKEKNADLIYQRAIGYFEYDPISEADYRGRSEFIDAEHGKLLHYLNIVKDDVVIADSIKEKLYNIAMIDIKKLVEKTNRDFPNTTSYDWRQPTEDNIYTIVSILKEDNVLKEKLYCFVRDNIENPNFWDNFYQIKGFSKEPIHKLHNFVFQQIKNYKDTTDWYKRLIYANEIPTIDEDSLKNRTSRIGISPQPRTVIAIGGMYNSSLKQEMKGNIFFTDDVEKACAIIHSEKNHYLWKTVDYVRGSPVKYYNTTIIVKIFSVNEKLLYSKSLSGNFSQPYQRVSQGITELYAEPKGDINITELAKVLEIEFAKFE